MIKFEQLIDGYLEGARREVYLMNKIRGRYFKDVKQKCEEDIEEMQKYIEEKRK